MKVLHVIPSVGPLRGGPSFAMRAIAGGLAARGIETHVATTDDNGPQRLDVPLAQPVECEGVVYWYFPRQTRFYTASIPFAKWLWRHAEDYELIHIHAIFSFCSNVAAWIARHKRIPYIIRPLGVLNRWGIENRRPLLKRISFAAIERRLLSSAALVQYTSEQERSEAEVLGFPHEAVIIPNPVSGSPSSRSDLQGRFRSRLPALTGRRIILFLSRVDRKKGLDILISAFSHVHAEDSTAALVIAGDGDQRLIAELQARIRQLGLEQSVFWVGFLEGTDKFAAMADAEMFVLPSYSENFGVAVVEAMALGVPVIISDQVGIHREVADAGAGIVTPAAVGPLAAAMSRVLTDHANREALSRRGSALVRSHFAAPAVIDQLIASYSTVLARGAVPCAERAIP